MDGSQGGGAASASNSSDFVRKLYKMLGDPSYSQVVRWGDEEDSFVVLECEKFTKSILPKHFKHSNFASFVRQLNKYDFHKVRQNNEESGQSPYGPNAWEFKHPEFKANNKDSLDNIRRKAPAPRKPTQLSEETVPIHQMDLMNQQLVAQQQQLEQLLARYTEINVNHQMMVQEVMRVQKTVLNHEHVIHQVMNFLHSVDAKQRRDSRATAHFPPQVDDVSHADPGMNPNAEQMPEMDDEPATPLQHASKLLNEMNADVQLNLTSLEQINDMHSRANGTMTTPLLDHGTRTNAGRPPTSAGSSSTMGYSKLNGELETVVYPVGTTNGIDPMYSEHVNNIPYSLPSKELDPNDPRRQYVDGRKKSTYVDPGWARNPHILLVEDDPTCRQIGGKFLYSFCCVIDTALDGLEAVSKVEEGLKYEGLKYDLILMDIIMPNLDGVSACHLIRQFNTTTPIIAMTSNIRSDDIQMYFSHGMNDVLPKPFTRKSLLDMLEKQLSHLKTPLPGTIQGIEPPPSATATSMTQGSTTHSVKDDSSPGQSPANSMNNWQSPSQFQGVSPIPGNVQTQYVQAIPTPTGMQTSTGYTMDQNGGQYQNPQTPINAARQGQHRRQISEMSSGNDMNSFPKRQRIYGQPNPMISPMQTGRPS